MSLLRNQIIADYQERVAFDMSIPSELKVSLKSHERVPMFVDNLVKQINLFPKNHKMDRVKLKQLVYAMTDVFVLAVKRTAEDRYRSDMDKMIEKAKSEVDYGLDKDGNGLIKELGIEVKDG